MSFYTSEECRLADAADHIHSALVQVSNVYTNEFGCDQPELLKMIDALNTAREAYTAYLK